MRIPLSVARLLLVGASVLSMPVAPSAAAQGGDRGRATATQTDGERGEASPAEATAVAVATAGSPTATRGSAAGSGAAGFGAAELDAAGFDSPARPTTVARLATARVPKSPALTGDRPLQRRRRVLAGDRFGPDWEAGDWEAGDLEESEGVDPIPVASGGGLAAVHARRLFGGELRFDRSERVGPVEGLRPFRRIRPLRRAKERARPTYVPWSA